MKFGRSNNPMFSEKAIAKAKAEVLDSDLYGNDNRGGAIIEETMTVSGAVNKTIMSHHLFFHGFRDSFNGASLVELFL